ncbi:MAG: sulfotransferase family protein [Acidimicrobiia bacterium]
MTRIINMWAGPRNISTGMMYAWAQRADTTVWDEPMYAHFLVRTGVDHPMGQLVVDTDISDRDEVVAAMLSGDCPTPIVFYKNMAHHLDGFDVAIVDQMDNFLLTRDPAHMLPSLTRGLGRVPTLDDTAYPAQVEILDRIVASGRTAIVVDSRSVLDDPRGTLTKLCAALDIGFDAAMLSWEEGPKPYDGVWGPHWYTRLHQTTGFEPYTPPSGELPSDLVDLYDTCAPLYERLRVHAI